VASSESGVLGLWGTELLWDPDRRQSYIIDFRQIYVFEADAFFHGNFAMGFHSTSHGGLVKDSLLFDFSTSGLSWGSIGE